MSAFTVIVNNKSFDTTKETLVNSGYFESIIVATPEQTSVVIHDRSGKLFEHVLNYLRDNEYPFPGKYHKELDFYRVKKAPLACPVYDCYEKADVLCSKFCSQHRCQYTLCDDRALQFYNYCENHCCKLLGCGSPTGTIEKRPMKYCRDHACHSDDCNSVSEPYGIFCHDHRAEDRTL